MRFKLIFALFLGFSPMFISAQTLMTVESGTSITLQAATEFTIDSLYLKPNWQATIPGGTVLSRSTVPVIANGFRTISKHYHFSGAPIAFRGRIQINYRDDELNNIAEQSLRMNYHDGVSWKYFTSNYTLAPVDNYLTANTVDMVNLKDITLGTPSAVLPLTWGRITGECVGSLIRLNWETVQEMNTSHFVVERSLNGRDWEVLGQRLAGGNSSTPRSYALDDMNTPASVVYYRIKIVDIDGTYGYSGVVPVQRCGSAETWKVYPVPAKEVTSLYVHAAVGYSSEWRLVSVDGKVLRRQPMVIQSGSNQFPVNLSGLSAGVYYLQMATRDGGVEVIRISKQ